MSSKVWLNDVVVDKYSHVREWNLMIVRALGSNRFSTRALAIEWSSVLILYRIRSPVKFRETNEYPAPIMSNNTACAFYSAVIRFYHCEEVKTTCDFEHLCHTAHQCEACLKRCWIMHVVICVLNILYFLRCAVTMSSMWNALCNYTKAKQSNRNEKCECCCTCCIFDRKRAPFF